MPTPDKTIKLWKVGARSVHEDADDEAVRSGEVRNAGEAAADESDPMVRYE